MMPATVAGVGFAAASAAVVHVFERNGRVAHDAVAADALDVGDEADTAAILFVRGIVKTLLLRQISVKFNFHNPYPGRKCPKLVT